MTRRPPPGRSTRRRSARLPGGGAPAGRGTARRPSLASHMARPRVDVVVPFRGDAAALALLRGRLAALELAPGDSLLVVDNTPGAAAAAPGPVRVLPAV